MRLLLWLLKTVQKCHQKVVEELQVAEYSTVISICAKCFEAIQNNSAILALLHLSSLDDQGCKLKIVSIVFPFQKN